MSETDTIAQPMPASSRVLPAAVLSRAEQRRVGRYGVVGVCNVVLDFVIYALLVQAGLYYVAAKALSLAVATANGYTWNRRWTFRTGAHEHSHLARYVAVQAVCFGANAGLLLLMVEVLGLGAVTAQLIAIPPVAALSFLANRLWTFGDAVDRGA